MKPVLNDYLPHFNFDGLFCDLKILAGAEASNHTYRRNDVEEICDDKGFINPDYATDKIVLLTAEFAAFKEMACDFCFMAVLEEQSELEVRLAAIYLPKDVKDHFEVNNFEAEDNFMLLLVRDLQKELMERYAISLIAEPELTLLQHC